MDFERTIAGFPWTYKDILTGTYLTGDFSFLCWLVDFLGGLFWFWVFVWLIGFGFGFVGFFGWLVGFMGFSWLIGFGVCFVLFVFTPMYINSVLQRSVFLKVKLLGNNRFLNGFFWTLGLANWNGIEHLAPVANLQLSFLNIIKS